MNFKVESTLQYEVKEDSTIILNISAAKTVTQTIMEESISFLPSLPSEELITCDRTSRQLRIECAPTKSLSITYKALVHHSVQLIDKKHLTLVAISALPPDVLPFLLPSRYCQSDKLLRLAQDKFGAIAHPYDRVVAICQWINKNVDYVSGSTDSDTSAFDTVTQREGVCRDFAHLGIALCRALTIPARYLSCYAYQLSPPDYHACFEVYLGGKWIVFDPTKLAPLNGLIKIGTGRDATDVAVASMYGNVQFTSMEVSCQVQDDHFQPLFLKDLEHRGLSL